MRFGYLLAVLCAVTVLLISCPLAPDAEDREYAVSPAMEKAMRFLDIDIDSLEKDIPHAFHENLEHQGDNIFSVIDEFTGEEIRVYVTVEEKNHEYRIVVEKEYARSAAYDTPLRWDFACQPDENRSVEMVQAFRYWEFHRKDNEHFSLVLVDFWIADSFYLDDAAEPYEYYADNWVYRADGTYDPHSSSISMDAVEYSKYVPRVDISEAYDIKSDAPYAYTIQPLYDHEVIRLCETLNFIDLFEGQDAYEHIQVMDTEFPDDLKDNAFFTVYSSDITQSHDDEARYIGHAELTHDGDKAVMLLWGNRFDESSLPDADEFTYNELISVEIRPGTQEGTEPDAWIMDNFFDQAVPTPDSNP